MAISGILFSLIIAGLTLKVMRDIMVGKFGLREIAPGSWRGYIREGRYNVEVHIKRRGEEVLFLLPDKSIPEEICRKVVRRLSAKLYALVHKTEMPPENVEIVGPANSFCYYCLEPVYMPFRCNRCGGYFCSEHRLPEKHNCPGDEEREAIASVKRPEREEKAERKRKKIFVKAIACG